MNDNYIPGEDQASAPVLPAEEAMNTEPEVHVEAAACEYFVPADDMAVEDIPAPAEEASIDGQIADLEAASEEPAPMLEEAEANTEDENPVEAFTDEEIPVIKAEESFGEPFFSPADSEISPVPAQEEPVSEAEVTDIIIETLAEEALEQPGAEDAAVLLSPLAVSENAAAEPAPEIPEAKKERPVRKGRPRRKKGDGLLSIPHMLSAVIWLLIIVAIGTSLGRIAWVCVADVLAFGRESKEVSISITAEDTLETIAEKLHENGLIKLPELFLLYADLADVEEENKITTGTFTLNTIYDYNALVNHMGPRATNRVVIEDVLIPEGYNCRQIFALLEEKGICKASDLEAYAANGELADYWFLEGVERGHKYCLEGFLFPDTYDFYENSTPKLALEKLLSGFKYRYSQELQDQLPVLNEKISEMMRKNGESEEYIAANQLTLKDLLTVASMIEKETSGDAESPRIASVIYNRLYSWGDSPRYLGIDATLIYALDGKADLTEEDLAMDSPYNTRNHEGLTPGPITNPGLASIQAALNPEDTGYYYYVLNPETGSHMFAKTLAEHNKNVEKYRELLKAMEAQAAAQQEAEEHEE